MSLLNCIITTTLRVYDIFSIVSSLYRTSLEVHVLYHVLCTLLLCLQKLEEIFLLNPAKPNALL